MPTPICSAICARVSACGPGELVGSGRSASIGLDQQRRGHPGDVVHGDRRLDHARVRLADRARRLDGFRPDREVLQKLAGPELGVDQAGRGDGVGVLLPVRAARERHDVPDPRLLDQLERGPQRLRERRQVHPFNAGQSRGQRFGVAQVTGDSAHAIGQLRPGGVLGQRADVVGAQVDQVINDASADVSSGSGHENGHDFHRTWHP